MYELLSDRCTGLAHRLENGSVVTALDPNPGLFPSIWDETGWGNTCSIYSTYTKKLDLFPCFILTWHIRLAGECTQASWRGVWSRWRTVDNCCLHLCVWGLHLDFQCSDRRVKSVLEMAGGGHSGLGRCRPSISGVSCGLWVALVGVQSPREAWAALRWAKRWVMEKPAFPSSCDSTTSTCLQREVKTKEERLQPSAFPKSMLFIETYVKFKGKEFNQVL